MTRGKCTNPALPLRLGTLLVEHRRVGGDVGDRLGIGQTRAAEQLKQCRLVVAPHVMRRLHVGVDERRVELVVVDLTGEIGLEDRPHVGSDDRDDGTWAQPLIEQAQQRRRVAGHQVLEDVAHVDLVDLVAVLAHELRGVKVDVSLDVGAGVDVGPALHVGLATPEIDSHCENSVPVPEIGGAQCPSRVTTPLRSGDLPGWTARVKALSR